MATQLQRWIKSVSYTHLAGRRDGDPHRPAADAGKGPAGLRPADRGLRERKHGFFPAGRSGPEDRLVQGRGEQFGYRSDDVDAHGAVGCVVNALRSGGK